MRIGDVTYFAPDLPFARVELVQDRLGLQWQRRLEGFYLTPAVICAEQQFAFAAGLLTLAAVDAMARYQYYPRRRGRKRKVGQEVKKFVREELPSFRSERLARSLYDSFRNGVAHEGRLKKGAVFRMDQGVTVEDFGVVSVNPKRLVGEVREALSGYVAAVAADADTFAGFLGLLENDFEEELATSRRTRLT